MSKVMEGQEKAMGQPLEQGTGKKDRVKSGKKSARSEERQTSRVGYGEGRRGEQRAIWIATAPLYPHHDTPSDHADASTFEDLTVYRNKQSSSYSNSRFRPT